MNLSAEMNITFLVLPISSPIAFSKCVLPIPTEL